MLALAACVFLWTPISSVRTSTLSTVDVLQNNTLTQIARNYQPRNQVLSDPFTEFVPWILYAKAELLNGRLPLWNPMNGAGAPLLGNYQSAPFSLFSAPFYLLSLKLALLVTAFARVFLTGWFTYLLLRRLALAELAALGGALAFSYCGYNTLLLSYPHSAVSAYLPAVLWCVEVVVQRCELAWPTGAKPRITAWLVLLCALLVGQTLAGHPETLYFCLVITAAWVLARLATLAWRMRAEPRGVARTAWVGVRLLIVGVLAALLSAPQLAPFFEYLANCSRLNGEAPPSIKPITLEHWASLVFPDMFGRPTDGEAFGPKLPLPNYEIANLAYTGALVGLLALISMLRLRRDARAAVSSVLLVGWACWAYGVPGFERLTALIPGASHAPPWVSQVVGVFAAAVLAAFELDTILRSSAKRRWLGSAGMVVLCGVLLAVVVSSARTQIAAVAQGLSTPADKVERAHEHVWAMSLWIAGGALVLAAAYVTSNTFARRALVTLGLVSIFVQTAMVFAPYQTVCADRYVYPRTRAMITLRRLVGDNVFLSLTREGMPANTNMVYGLRQAANYDALMVNVFNIWHSASCSPIDMWRAAMTGDEAVLTSLGAEYCAIRPPGVSAPPEENGKPTPHWRGDPARLQLVGRAGGQLIHRFDAPVNRARLAPYAILCTDEADWRARSTTPGPAFETTVMLGPDTPASFAVRTRADAARDLTESVRKPGPRGKGLVDGGTATAGDSNESDVDEDAPARKPANARGESKRRARARARAGSGRVTVLDELPMALRLRVDAPSANYLVLTKANYPGWTARIDGVETPLVRANYAFCAVDVPAGEHVVEVRYEPASWRWGLALGAAGLLGLVVFGFLGRARERSA